MVKRLGINHREAMNIYSPSKLTAQIHTGQHGIHYLDAADFVDALLANEKDVLGTNN